MRVSVSYPWLVATAGWIGAPADAARRHDSRVAALATYLVARSPDGVDRAGRRSVYL